MSDIGFYGFEAALVSLGMLAVAGIALLVEGWQWRKGSPLRGRALIVLLPLVYGLLAVAILYIVEEGSLAWRRGLDDGAWLVAAGGLVVWASVRTTLSRWSRRTDATAS
jgi:hypothetical protein